MPKFILVIYLFISFEKNILFLNNNINIVSIERNIINIKKINAIVK